MIGDENEALHVSLFNMHMRMQVSTGWRITAIQMAANTCQYMTKLPARSTISDSFALVGFYIFTFLLRSYRTDFDYAVFKCCFHSASSQRLGRDPKPDPLLFLSSSSCRSQSTLFLRHLAYTLHTPYIYHPDKPQSLESHPPMLDNGFSEKRELGYGIGLRTCQTGTLDIRECIVCTFHRCSLQIFQAHGTAPNRKPHAH